MEDMNYREKYYEAIKAACKASEIREAQEAEIKRLREIIGESLKIAREPEEFPSMQERESAIIAWKKRAQATLTKGE